MKIVTITLLTFTLAMSVGCYDEGNGDASPATSPDTSATGSRASPDPTVIVVPTYPPQDLNTAKPQASTSTPEASQSTSPDATAPASTPDVQDSASADTNDLPTGVKERPADQLPHGDD
jgi:hypothetical protein